MLTHFHGIGNFRKLKLGPNPISNMPSAKLMTRGMRRGKGESARKLPFTVGDLRSLGALLGLNTVGRIIVWCVTLLGGGYVENERNPIDY